MFVVTISLLAAAVVASLAAAATTAHGGALLPAGALTATPTPEGCLQTWSAVESPQVNGELHGVDATARNDVWVVGNLLIEHWDGEVWTAITSTNAVTDTHYQDVVAISTNNAWAVGYSLSGHPVIAHWDGIEWGKVSTPADQLNYRLFGIDAISADDAWAVGGPGSFYIDKAFVMHWDGTAWSIINTPDPRLQGSGLYAVTAIATDDVWAVGYDSGSGSGGAMFMHWDGAAWTESPEIFDNSLVYGVDAVSSDDVWGAGIYWNGTTAMGLIFHWDGTEWTQQLSIPDSRIQLNGVKALAVDDVWVVGKNLRSTIIEHWDGTQWTRVDSPGPMFAPGELWDIAAVSPQEMWAVGNALDSVTRSMIGEYSRWCPPPVVCEPGLHLIGSPNPAPNFNVMEGVDALAPDDIWAAGGFLYSEAVTTTAAEHWNGSYWEVVPMPDVPNSTYFNDVNMISHNDVWAIGLRLANPNHSATAHWDGVHWTMVPSPNPGTIGMGTRLDAVSGVSSNDVWAVGSYYDGAYKGLILHWNGTAWAQVAHPAGALYGVVALAGNNVWAVGTTFPGTTGQTLVMNWDGATWSIVSCPNLSPGENVLESVSAVSASDIWAAGHYYDSATGTNPLMMHWNGATWTIQNLTLSGNGELDDVAAVGPNNVWAVGSDYSDDGVTIHWDGTTWTVLPNPISDPTVVDYLHSVVVVSPNEVWMVGEQWHGPWLRQTLVERYVESCPSSTPTVTSTSTPTITPMSTATSTSSGTSTPTATSTYISSSTPMATATNTSANTSTPMATSASTNTRTSTPILTATRTGTSTPTATNGRTNTSTPLATAVSTSTRTPTVIVTATATGTRTKTATPTINIGTATATLTGTIAAVPTNTNVPATLTSTNTTVPTNTPVVCSVRFQDVPPDHTFYAQVICLACEGIISGYPCGGPGEPCGATGDPYFRPGNGITRGQIAKIVAGAAGFTEPVSGQSFQDISLGSPFYEAIERLLTRGVVGGYPCGGMGEPCGAGNLPYFRPNGSATRGQIAKIVSESAAFGEPVSEQAFEDVGVGSTFYDYVGRLATRGVMSGYPCGETGEPCRAGDLPYFRPNSNATRGQTSKIVTNTYLPECAP